MGEGVSTGEGAPTGQACSLRGGDSHRGSLPPEPSPGISTKSCLLTVSPTLLSLSQSLFFLGILTMEYYTDLTSSSGLSASLTRM